MSLAASLYSNSKYRWLRVPYRASNEIRVAYRKDQPTPSSL